MIAILDYGAGNLRSVQNTLDAIGAEYTAGARRRGLAARIEDHPARSRPLRPDDAMRSTNLAFAHALLNASIARHPVPRHLPWLAGALSTQSPRRPKSKASASSKARSSAFRHDARVPHMGWNTLDCTEARPAAERDRARIACLLRAQLLRAVTAARRPPAPIRCPTRRCSKQGNIFGVQFHPEKSGPAGMKIVRNFVEL